MGCCSLPEIDWTAFEEYLYNKAISKRIPLSANLELTHRCNLRCVHCYVACHNNYNKKFFSEKSIAQMEMKTHEIYRIIDQLVDEGTLYLTLTGGEPLVREDFEQIYRYIKMKGLLVTLLTNGTLFTEKLYNLLSELPPKAIEITIYGITEKTHESITKVPGSFQKTMSNVDKLVGKNFNLKLKTIVMRLNKHELEGMKDFAKNLAIPFKYSALIFPHLSKSKVTYKCRLSAQEVARYDIEDPGRRAAWEALLKMIPCNTNDINNCYLYHCNAASVSFWIDPYGKLSACHLARFPNYDLVRGNFKEGWHYFLYRHIRLKKLGTPTECTKCKLRAICDQCPGWAQLENKNEWKKGDYLCEIAHLRAEGFGVPD